MFHVFIAEATAVLAYCEPHSVASGAIIGARVFGIEGLDGVATFYADWHCMSILVSSGHCAWRTVTIFVVEGWKDDALCPKLRRIILRV
jgi:hypothetical protein